MGMMAIFVMGLGTFQQTFVPPSHRSYIWNFILTGSVVSEVKLFKEFGRRRTMTTTMNDDGRTTEAYLSFTLTNEHSAQVS